FRPLRPALDVHHDGPDALQRGVNVDAAFDVNCHWKTTSENPSSRSPLAPSPGRGGNHIRARAPRAGGRAVPGWHSSLGGSWRGILYSSVIIRAVPADATPARPPPSAPRCPPRPGRGSACRRI